jgi:hypothetical protein
MQITQFVIDLFAVYFASKQSNSVPWPNTKRVLQRTPTTLPLTGFAMIFRG